MTRAFTPSRVLAEPQAAAVVLCGDCGNRGIDDEELMERLLVDWPVVGNVLARLASLKQPPELSVVCRKRGLAAYAAALEDEDRNRLLAFIDAVADCAAELLQPTDGAALSSDLIARALPVRVQRMLNETRARKRSLIEAT
ncbi:hypothetical protein [Azospirillum sp. B506]|uniref:hypothetical protein n=1 Tax=Azospirillum sp. B506 TaxID=137721 RepID=UPI0011DD843E|nr:hypothetical protein [Azospirillum sp. B506]